MEGWEILLVFAMGSREEYHQQQQQQQQPMRSPSDDGDSGSEDEETTTLHRRAMYPVPHSHWFPRSLSFKPWNGVKTVRQPSGGGGGRGGVGGVPRSLRIQVSRPVQLFTLNGYTVLFTPYHRVMPFEGMDCNSEIWVPLFKVPYQGL